MLIMNHSTMLVCCASLITVACTKTVYQEVPVDAMGEPIATVDPAGQAQAPAATPVQSVENAGNGEAAIPAVAVTPAVAPAAPTSVTDSSAGVDTGTVTDNAPIPAAENPAPAFNDSLPEQTLGVSDPASVSGAPGMLVDCEQQLPCRWISDDEQLSITVTSVDNIASRGRLSVSFQVDTLHDTNALLGNAGDAVGAGGTRYTLTNQTFGTGNGIAPVEMTAGTAVVGHLDYDHAASDTSLDGWSLTLFDNGLPRAAEFTGLPVGPASSIASDCAGTLPCSWSSADGEVTVTLLSVGGFASNGRMTVNFLADTTASTSVALDAGATAIGTDGTRFEGRTHTLGGVSDFNAVTQDVTAGIATPASVNFFRTDSTPSQLNTLTLVLYENRPSPRWNPVFTTVPVQ